MSVLIFLVVSYILLSISLFLIFKKTDVNPVKGLIPGMNFIEWCKLIGRKPAYSLWLLFPIVNIFIFAGMAVDLVRSFGKFDFKHSAAAVIYAPAIFTQIALDKDSEYEGPTLPKEKKYAEEMAQAVKEGDKFTIRKLEKDYPYKKTVAREWTESIVFAVFAAAFIRMFLIEAYIIPTASMEGSLLVGDFLFVSKAHYGIRTPQTIAMFPLLHNTIPIIKKESYLKKPQLPYYRLPKIQSVAINDPFVFNWPAGDSVYLTKKRSYSAHQATMESTLRSDPQLRAEVKKGNLRVRPADKTDFYIKRCVGLPGDSLQIIDNQIYVNGEKAINPEHMQFLYTFDDSKVKFIVEDLEKHGITKTDVYGRNLEDQIVMAIDQKQADIIREIYPNAALEVSKYDAEPEKMFPNDPKNFNTWSLDNFGPVYIPKAGETVTITPKNLALYKRVIGTYEKNKLEVRRGEIFVNDVKTTKYTFQQDYYWAMGDNRHSSEDSRFWGFVPEDHVVGKPMFIWMSIKDGSLFNGIRWSRIFRSASK